MVALRSSHSIATPALLGLVRFTARSSAALFSGAAVASVAGGRVAAAGRPLYSAFLLAHVSHFAAVAGYAVRTDGRDLFPGGRSLDALGGWPSLLGVDSLFLGLAFAGWSTVDPGAARPVRITGRVATGVIGAMFAGTYAAKWAAHVRGYRPARAGGPL
jgi:hypothetical protein